MKRVNGALRGGAAGGNLPASGLQALRALAATSSARRNPAPAPRPAGSLSIKRRREWLRHNFAAQSESSPNPAAVGCSVLNSASCGFSIQQPYPKTQKAHEGLFVFLVEAAGIEPASANRPKTVLHT